MTVVSVLNVIKKALVLLEGLTKKETRSEEPTSELQSRVDLVSRLLLEKKKRGGRGGGKGGGIYV